MLEGQLFTLPGLPDATNPPGRLAQFMRLLDSLAPNELGTLVEAAIERLDARAGDPDMEDDDSDRCAAGHDGVFAGPPFHMTTWRRPVIGDAGHERGCEDDAEDWCPPAYQIDQTRPLYVTAANDWPELRK